MNAMLSARAIAAEIAEARTSVVDVLARVQARIAEFEPKVRAYVDRLPQDLVQAASGPLAGVPFAAKDVFDTYDLPTQYGSPIYAGHRPAIDATVVAQARSAGAMLIGKTVATEFSLFTAGPTSNPHDLSRTPGGSSSGSAAAVAAGMAAFAFGAQTAGSIIRPASFCGVAGFKPSFGTFSVTGVKAVAPSLDTVGLFAASVSDIRFVMKGLTGKRFEPLTDKRWRIGVCKRWNDAQPSNAMSIAIEKAALALERAGVTIVPIQLPSVLEEADAAHMTIMAYEAARELQSERQARNPAISAKLSEFLALGSETPPAVYSEALAVTEAGRLAAVDMFGAIDALLTPSAPGAAPIGFGDTGSAAFNRLWTTLGLPAVNVPGLMSAEIMPLGLQVIGGSSDNEICLSAAEAISRQINIIAR